MDNTVSVLTELSDAQALALAQLVKRVGWQEVRVNAVDDDEAYLMKDALASLQRSLADSGYAPR
ncbi:hypothetical protein GCM10011403_15250 [Pseudohongiella nitratireducens]|jgi:hypothetical protein|uniref:Uncharacterized protein n=2 Tax=Pseudomonadales TaxID=72274 RepID=A0A917GW78_9GAMM|nr:MULTISPECIES: hypothetical protein [Gammaproteobacteria]MDS0773403.1 hypothetical protein [Escherichia coli]MDT3795468.1 hypothetical protein [Escherichia coli]NWN90402.1 hypothetical protein [Marinobacter adhaerens]GGG58825.1 hypothetical protein GCM10011403_15250 [Pseudohongiella nitratireducens]|tara:strand:- start:22022 stop:22213 length:192 start_codon:yes stop_codon:yes gene_type:complete